MNKKLRKRKWETDNAEANERIKLNKASNHLPIKMCLQKNIEIKDDIVNYTT